MITTWMCGAELQCSGFTWTLTVEGHHGSTCTVASRRRWQGAASVAAERRRLAAWLRRPVVVTRHGTPDSCSVTRPATPAEIEEVRAERACLEEVA